jgi:thiol:disulfide interchange protein
MKLKGLAIAALIVASCAAIAQTPGSTEKLPWQNSGAANGTRDQVQFLDPAQVTVAAGKASVVAIHFRVADGLHINSHTPHTSNLIATQLLVVDGDGLKTQNIEFPPGTDTSFAFAPKDKVSVYTGEFVLKAHIVAAPGKHEWQGVMRYQACTTDVCLPPRKLPIVVDVIAN